MGNNLTRALAATSILLGVGCSDVIPQQHSSGTSSGSGSGSSSGSPECTSVACKAIYQKAYGGGSGEVDLISLAEDEAGYVYVFGNFKGTLDFGLGPLENFATHWMPFLIKLDPNGDVVWQRRPHIGSMVRPYGGPLIVLGSLADEEGKFKSFFVGALDGDGEPLWTSPFGALHTTFASCCSTHISLGAGGDILLASSFYSYGAPFDFGGGVTLDAPSDLQQTWFVARWDKTGKPIFATNVDAAGIACCPKASAGPSGETFVTSTNHTSASLSPNGDIESALNIHMAPWDIHFDQDDNRLVFGFLHKATPNFGAGPITFETEGPIITKVTPGGEALFVVKPDHAPAYLRLAPGPSGEVVYADYDPLEEPPAARVHKLDVAGNYVWHLDPLDGPFNPLPYVGPTGNIALVWPIPGGIGVAKLPP